MKMQEILLAIQVFSRSQGFYGMLYERLMEIQDNTPEDWEAVVHKLEAQHFTDAVEMALFFES